MGSDSAPAAPLEKAVEESRKALADYDGCKGYEADEYALCCIEPFRLLLAALDADKSACEPGVICPTCVALEKAEAALMEIRAELGVPQPGYPAPVANAADIARRYFAEKGER